jgi:hypothetical protein
MEVPSTRERLMFTNVRRGSQACRASAVDGNKSSTSAVSTSFPVNHRDAIAKAGDDA